MRKLGLCLAVVVAVLGCASGEGARRAAPVKAQEVEPMRLGFVLLGSAGLPAPKELAAAHQALAPQGEPGLPSEAEVVKKDGMEGVALKLGEDSLLMVFLVPRPVPEGEAEEAARFSLPGLADDWRPAKHAAHLLVVFSDAEGRTPVQTHRRFTWMLAAVTKAAAGNAVGVYSGQAGATFPPDFFLKWADKEDEAGLVMLWSGVSVAKEGEGRMSLLSLGMEELGLPNLLLTSPQDKGQDALRMFYNLLAYVADRGEPIPEGDTVGADAVQKLPVRYQASPADAQAQVWRVDLP